MSARRCLPGALPLEGCGASRCCSTPERPVPTSVHGATSKSRIYGTCGGHALASIMFGPSSRCPITCSCPLGSSMRGSRPP
eukprot:5335429-Alexandrium_andersonii.AAC.1